MKAILALFILNFFAAKNVAACAQPPVRTAEQNVCFAKQFVEQSKPNLELRYQAKELATT
jgi:hypothetical protein